MKEWVVIASRAQAKIFKKDKEKLIWQRTIVNPDGRKKGIDITTDIQGMSFPKYAFSPTPRRFQKTRSVKEMVAIRFADEIAKNLKTGFNKKLFEKITIFAEPHFLGKLRVAIQRKIKGVKVETIPKGLGKSVTKKFSYYFEKA